MKQIAKTETIDWNLFVWKTDYADLEADARELAADNETLKATDADLRKELGSLEFCLRAAKADVSDYEADLMEITGDMQAMKAELDEAKATIQKANRIIGWDVETGEAVDQSPACIGQEQGCRCSDASDLFERHIS